MRPIVDYTQTKRQSDKLNDLAGSRTVHSERAHREIRDELSVATRVFAIRQRSDMTVTSGLCKPTEGRSKVKHI